MYFLSFLTVYLMYFQYLFCLGLNWQAKKHRSEAMGPQPLGYQELDVIFLDV